MTVQDLFSTPAAMFATPILDVERAKRLYLAQFVHVGCGGAPVAYVGPAGDQLGCTCCPLIVPAAKTLGESLVKARVFKSLVI